MNEPIENVQIRALLDKASVEMTCKDVKDLAEVAQLLPAGSDIFIALFPNQTWDDSIEASKAVKAVGLNPVPHIPARRVKDRAEVATIGRRLAGEAGVTRLLLIAGDMPSPEGAFDSTIGVLETGEFTAAGIRDICMAGHPEGHAHMNVAQLRQYEARKVELSKSQGFNLTFVTQVCFEAEPMIEWEKVLRASGITNPVRPGLAGPASITTLLRYAKICGAGASIRALTSGKAGLVGKLLGDSGPEIPARKLARAQGTGETKFAGAHFFAFGGFLKTCKWVSAVQAGRFVLDGAESFSVTT
ncbi:MAG TPA: methylenetetrahydrofolate reductase [Steroidobacteraceae bacterium]|jgi:methylenetetrahydrofolate reductase (NADPH)|nr:methylenetetrahydrofolate reductase [Steroidobacteraceae bacterium]